MSKKTKEEREKIRQELNKMWSTDLRLTETQLDLILEIRNQDITYLTKENSNGEELSHEDQE